MKYILILVCFGWSALAHSQKPIYTQKSSELIKDYSSDSSCIDSNDICEQAQIIDSGHGLIIHLGGEYSDKDLFLEDNYDGTLSFSNEDYDESCDDSGCANVLSISGQVYPKKQNGEWVPVIKVDIEFECSTVDEDAGCYNTDSFMYSTEMN